jgi:hypothetical protein
VELAHWLHQILQAQDSDLHRMVSAEFLGRMVQGRPLARVALAAADGEFA